MSNVRSVDDLFKMYRVAGTGDSASAPVEEPSSIAGSLELPRPSATLPTQELPMDASPDESQRHANWFESALDLLARPNYAVAGAARYGLQGQNPLEGAARGFTGKDRTTFGDILREDYSMNPALAGILGFGLDVVTDPTNLIGIGGLTKAGKAARVLTLAHDAAVAAGDTKKAAALAADLAKVGGRLAEGGAAQAAAHQRGLVSILGHAVPLPVAVNEAAFNTGDTFASWFLNSPIGKRLAKGRNETLDMLKLPLADAQQRGQAEFVRAALPYRKATEDVMKALGHTDTGVIDDAVSSIVEMYAPGKLDGDFVKHLPDKALRSEYNQLTRMVEGAKKTGVWGVDLSKLSKAEQSEYKALVELQDKAASGIAMKYKDKTYTSMPVNLRSRLRKLEKMAQSGVSIAEPDAVSRLSELRSLAQKTYEAKELSSTIKSVSGIFGQQRGVFEPYARDIATFINTFNSGILNKTQKAGIPLMGLDSMGYLKHMMTDDGKAALFKKLGVKKMRDFTEKHGSQLARQWEGFTVAELNKAAKQGRLPGFKGIVIDKLFESNPLVATAWRAGEAERAVAAANLFDGAVRLWGSKSPSAVPASWKELKTEIPKLKGAKLPPEIADQLNKLHTAMAEPEGMVKVWDDFNDTWKRYTLSLFPVYHIRNVLGDFWNAVVLGETNPMYLKHSVEAMVAHATGDLGREIKLGNKKLSVEQVLGLAEKLGVSNNGAYGELHKTVLGPLAEKRFGLGDMVRDNFAINAGLKVGQAREQSLRLAMFMDRIAKGMAPEVAALDVKKFMFDFNDLTDFERGKMRLVFPFYSWIRKNIPLQMEMLFAKPGRFAAIQHARDEMGGGEGIASSDLPDFLRHGTPVPFGKNPEGFDQYLRMNGTLPAADLTGVSPAGLLDNAMHMLSPALQVPLSLATNVDIPSTSLQAGRFTTLDRDGTNPNFNFLGQELPSRMKPIVGTVRALTELDRLNPGDVFGTYESPGIGGVQRDYPDVDPGLRLANILVGRPYPIDSGLQDMRSEMERQQEIMMLLRALGRAGGPKEVENIQHSLNRR